MSASFIAVKAKKHLGQHFLKDEHIAQQITLALQKKELPVLEIGAGTGVLTQFLLNDCQNNFFAIDVDAESLAFLKNKFPEKSACFINADFLTMRLNEYFGDAKIGIIGNFPYHISTQIMFKVLDDRQQIIEVVGMFQKEVAERLAARPGTKSYGILSVLLQAFFSVDYLFTVHEDVFIPPPKVKSGVVRLIRNTVEKLACDETLFKQIIKLAFNQRRKMLRNSMAALLNPKSELALAKFLTQRPETLSVADFVFITQQIEAAK